MNCRYCGWTLQPGALFCVECGRSVVEVSAPQAAPARGPAPSAGASTDGPAARPADRHAADAPHAVHCPQCGGTIENADIFCNECGFVLRPMTGVAAPVPSADVESTRMMASRGRGERYVLQFSTGESIVVGGTGLIGRNPSPEPGEYVDELVSIFDVGKSVSKSHVEFGQDAGRFWVSDRYSTNGTIVRQPDVEPVRCEPGKRYLIARGSRVEIGEQFFIVS